VVVLEVPAQAGVAQLVEQLIRNQQVTSSSLVAGSRNFPALSPRHLIALPPRKSETFSHDNNLPSYRCDPLVG
jgi:hypothetical protein